MATGMFGGSPIQKAFLAPFITFMALLALGELVAHLFDGWAFWMVSAPRYWVFPLQTVVCGAPPTLRHGPLDEAIGKNRDLGLAALEAAAYLGCALLLGHLS